MVEYECFPFTMVLLRNASSNHTYLTSDSCYKIFIEISQIWSFDISNWEDFWLTRRTKQQISPSYKSDTYENFLNWVNFTAHWIIFEEVNLRCDKTMEKMISILLSGFLVVSKTVCSLAEQWSFGFWLSDIHFKITKNRKLHTTLY